MLTQAEADLADEDDQKRSDYWDEEDELAEYLNRFESSGESEAEAIAGADSDSEQDEEGRRIGHLDSWAMIWKSRTIGTPHTV